MQLHLDLEKYMECFDGVTFWIWEAKNIPNEIKDIYGAINDKVSYKYNAKLISEIIKEI